MAKSSAELKVELGAAIGGFFANAYWLMLLIGILHHTPQLHWVPSLGFGTCIVLVSLLATIGAAFGIQTITDILRESKSNG